MRRRPNRPRSRNPARHNEGLQTGTGRPVPRSIAVIAALLQIFEMLLELRIRRRQHHRPGIISHGIGDKDAVR